MPDKKVYLYDSSNASLQVRGIRVELYDAMTKTYIDGADSDDLNPGHVPSNTWGVVLNFPSGTTPVDIYISDADYKYPGNTLRFLNGDLRDEVYMDLLQVPTGPGGQPPIAAPGSVPQINSWVSAAAEWSVQEKESVRNLIFNYALIVVPERDRLAQVEQFGALARNWETALKRIGFSTEALSAVKSLTRTASA
ncbi:MAG: hypothetical protein LAN70_09005 [Acidobacteriia bacterium]|nr:hypothetical protein [Terriglobia bacterium]